MVETGSNMIKYIETDVVNGQLIIRQLDADIFIEKAVRVYLSVDSLEYVELNGSGDFDADHLNASTFEIKMNGSGNVDLNIDANTVSSSIDGSGDFNLLGNTTTFNGNIKGSGDIFAKYLYTDNSNIDIEGSGDATINVSNNLNATIYGSGNIYYYGNPDNVTSTIQGSGQLIQQ